MAEENIKPLNGLYNKLRKNGVQLPNEYTLFENAFTKPGKAGAENRHKLYNQMAKDGLTDGDDYSTWYTTYFQPVSKNSSKAREAGTPMTITERNNMMAKTAGMMYANKASADRANKQMARTKANTGLDTRTPKLGENRHVTEMETGGWDMDKAAPETTYVTESGNEYDQRTGADLEQNAIDEARMQNEQTETYLKQKQARLTEDLDKRAEEIDRKVDAEDGSNWFTNIIKELATGGNPQKIRDVREGKYNIARSQDTQYTSLKASLAQVDEALDTIKEGKKGKASDEWIEDSSNWFTKAGKNILAFGAGAGRGFLNTVGKVSTWDSGASDFATNAALRKANDKAGDKGENMGELPEEQRDLLNLAALNQKVQADNEEYIGHGYKAGQVTGEMAPFMAETALNPLSGTGKTAMKMVMKEAIKKYGKDAIRRNIGKYMAAKIGTRVLGDALGAVGMSLTTGLQKVAADAEQRMTGDIQYGYGDGGKVIFTGTKGKESAGRAYLKALTANSIENQSEMVGEYFSPFLKGAGKLLAKGLPKVTVERVGKFIDSVGSSDFAQMISNFESKAKWHGSLSEYCEEVVGNVENALLVGDQTLDTAKGTGVFNGEQNLDTFLGVTLLGGSISAAKTLGYRGAKRETANKIASMGKQIDKVFAGNIQAQNWWGGIRNTLMVGTAAEKRKALRSVLEDKTLPFSVRYSILQYSAQCQKFEGIVRSMRNRRGEDTVNDKQNDNYERGYAAKPQEMAAIKEAYTSAQEALCKAYDMPLEALETLNMEAIEHAARSGKDAKTKQAALDYLTAKAAYTGMIEHIHDDIKDAQDYHEAMIDNRTDETGNIQQITLKEKDANGGNRQMYLTKGKVVMTDDGTMVNVQASDKSLTVVDGQGRAKLISPKDIFRVDAPVKAEEEKKNVLSGISQEKSQRYADIIDGVTDAEGNPIENNTSTENTESTESTENTESTESAPVMPKVGETVDLTDAEGNKTPITVQAVNADGYEVTDGNRVWVMPADEMQEAVTPKVENTQTNVAENTTETATNGTVTETDQASNQVDGAASKTAMERIPTDEKTGEPMFEKADKATALDALNEMTQGNEEASEAIVNAQVAQAQKALDELKKKQPTRKAAVLKGTPMEMLQAQQKAEADYKASMEQYNNMVAEAEEKAKAWASIAEEMNNRKQAAVAQQEAERKAEEEVIQKAAEEQKKAVVETRQPEPAENQTEQAENKTEQEQVARSKNESEQEQSETEQNAPTKMDAKTEETEEEPQSSSKGANEESGLNGRNSSNQGKTKKSARAEGTQTERKPLSKRTQKACEAVADALGVDIEWVDHLDANGEYEQRGKNGRAVIRIARDAENPLSTVFGHEGVHAVRDLSEEAYQSLIAAARAVVGEEEWRNRHIAIRNRYKKYHLSKAGVTEEVVADIVGEMITDRNMAEQIAYRLDHPTLSALRDIARKLWEAVKKLAGNGELTEQEQAVKDFADTIERAFADAKKKAKMREEAISNGVSSVIDAANADAVGGLVFNLRTEEDVAGSLRNYLEAERNKEGSLFKWTDKEIEEIMSETADLITMIHDSLADNRLYEEWAKKDPTIRIDWRDGKEKPTVTWARNNVEYKYDVSADLLCINNEGIETVLSSPDMVELMIEINKSHKNGYTSDDYMRLYETMRDLGLNVPCKGCFDAAMRLKMLPSVARKFVDLVNETIDKRNADPEKFDANLRKKAGAEATVNGLPTSATTKADAIAVGVAGDNLTEHISWTQLMSAEGQTQALADWGGIFRAWQKTGAGRPKDKLMPEPYSGVLTHEVSTIIAPYGDKTPSFRDLEVNQGTGLRRNSHSEFRPLLAIDEIQFMRDAFFKNLCVFKYMKELDDVRLFGKMGVKFNMSFFPAFDKTSPVAGLDKSGNYIASEESVGSREFIYYDKNGKQHFDGMRGLEEAEKHINENVSLSSVVFSVPHLIKAFTDVPTPENKQGRWGSLIPFHASGATQLQLSKQGLGLARGMESGSFMKEAFTDYGKGVTNFEDVQNDRFGAGWTIVTGKKKGTSVKEGHKIEFANGNHYYNKELGLHLFSSFYVYDSDIHPEDRKLLMDPAMDPKEKQKLKNKIREYAGHDFVVDYNDKVRELGGDYAYKDAADFYLQMLPEIGLIPRFDFQVPEDVFLKMCEDAKVDPTHPKLGWKGEGHGWSPIDSPAYYSLFCDYGMTDPATGKWSPHRPVGYIDENGNRTFKLPDNTVDIVREGVNRYTEQRDKEAAMHDEVMEEYVKRTVADGKLSKKQGDDFMARMHNGEFSGKKLSLRSGESEDTNAIELVDAIRNLSPITVEVGSTKKEDVRESYNSLGMATNKMDGKTVSFYHSVFGKMWRGENSMFAKIAAHLKILFENSLYGFTSQDNLAGKRRPDGTIHKEHRNIESYDYYIAKARVEGKDYYVRFTIQNEQRSSSGVHDVMCTNVDIYENPIRDASTSTMHGERLVSNEVSDTKLMNLFKTANIADEKNAEEDADELKFRTVYGGNSGYVGYSKSKRAMEAEERGLRSVSQMDKEFADEVNRLVSKATGEESNLSLKKIRDIAKSGRYDEWHHTSMYGNRTKYYSADTIAESIVDAIEEENGREEREREMQKVKEREERLKELMTDEHDVTITVKDRDGDSLDFTYDVFRSSNGYAFPVKYNLTPLKASFGIQVLNEGQDKYWGGSPFLQDSYIEDHWEEIEDAVDEYNSRLAEAKEEVDTAKSSFVGEGFSESRDQSEENAMVDRVNGLSEKLHTPVRIIQTEEEMAQLPDSRQRRMKGSYNTRTGEVTIVVPNNANVADVENTFVHEAVGHDGLRLLFPEEGKLNHTLDELYRVSESGIRQKIDADAQKMYDAEVERIMERKRKEHEAKGENANATRYTDLAEAHVEASKKRDKFRRTATEEYAADLAGRIGEEGFERMSAEEQTFWGRLKGMLQKALDNLMQGMGIQSKHEWTDKDWAYVLHESYKRKKNGGKPSVFDMADTEAMKQKTGFGESMKAEEEVADTDILFRDGDAHDYDKARARDEYERKMRNGWFQTVEALQDSMLSLKEAMQGVLKAEGKGKVSIEDVAGFENAYLGENRLSSVNLAEENYAKRAYIDPLMKEVARIAPTADERAELTDYMMAKHGLERNDVMAQREAEKKAREEFKDELREAEKAVAKDPLDQDAKDALDDVKQRMADRARDLYFENRGRDYAGLTALTETDNVVDAEAEAAKMVADYEQKNTNTAKLWQLVNAVNAYTLQRTRESGIVSEDTYNDIKSMYHHYIPLRGFDETTSDEVYAYTPQKGNAFSLPIKTAKGRKSKADDPFANMEAMMEGAIVQGNRNTLVKQKFLNFVMNHPSDLFSVSDVWLAYDQVADEWKTVQSGDVANTEKIDDTDTPQEVERKMRDFEAVMEQLVKNNPNNFAKQSDEPSIPYRVVNKSDESQHQVVVIRDGKKKIITVNGNPRAAQALNGQTNPDSNQNKGFVNKTMEVGQNINRKLAGVYTSLNPDFVVSNYIRDMLYANTTVHIKENEKYALTFNGYCATLSSPAVLTSLYAKLKSGKLDEMKKNGTLKGLDASFYEFIMNGGETGFTAMKNIEKRKKDIERQIKKHAGKLPQAVAWDALNESLDFLNECIENSARFAAFLTSRKMGRTIDRSVWDAKEVSVNFNKKGAGDRFMGANGQTKIGNAASFISGAGRGLYVFWNAAIQGTANAGNIVVRHKAKSLAMMAALFGLGALTAAMGASGDGDDDYYDLPEYTRRSNIIFRFPGMKQWIAIPLSVEYRSLYGLGELASSTATGNGPTNEGDLATAIAEQTSQLLPLDFMEGGGGLHVLWPSFLKPGVEASSNQSWTGQPIYKDNEYNKTMPEWTKAYRSANKYIVWASKELNEATGGDDYKKGAVDFNPSRLEYLLSGYAGGLFSFADRLVKTAETIHGDREYDARNIPFLNRVVKQGDERTKDKAVNNRYFNMKEEAAETQKLLKGYTEASHDREDRERAKDYRELLRDLKQSPEYRRFKMFQREDKKVKALQDKRKDARSEKQREQIDDRLAQRKRILVGRISQLKEAE